MPGSRLGLVHAFPDARDGTLSSGDTLHTIGGESRAPGRGTLRFPLPSIVVFDPGAVVATG